MRSILLDNVKNNNQEQREERIDQKNLSFRPTDNPVNRLTPKNRARANIDPFIMLLYLIKSVEQMHKIMPAQITSTPNIL